MKTLKTGLFALVAGSVLLGMSGGLIHTGAALADGVASVACASSPPNWTDCAVTLNQNIDAGGSFAASLPAGDDTPAYCNDEFPFGTLCAVSGNSVIFSCPSGCEAGSQFYASVLGTAGAALAQHFSVTSASSDAIDQSPGPIRLGTSPVGAAGN